MNRSESGQATLETALCLPAAILLVAILIEVGFLATDHARLWHAAREGARVAAVDPDRDHVFEAVSSVGLENVAIDLSPVSEMRAQGDPVEIELRHRYVGRFPLVGKLFTGLTFEARATMRIERP